MRKRISCTCDEYTKSRFEKMGIKIPKTYFVVDTKKVRQEGNRPIRWDYPDTHISVVEIYGEIGLTLNGKPFASLCTKDNKGWIEVLKYRNLK